MSKQLPTDCYISWARCDEWGRPKRWSKAHETEHNGHGGLQTLCGAVQPADAEYGGPYEADGYCKRCQAIAKARRKAQNGDERG